MRFPGPKKRIWIQEAWMRFLGPKKCILEPGILDAFFQGPRSERTFRNARFKFHVLDRL